MDKQISTPWAVAAIVIVLLFVGAVVWRTMAPAPPSAADPTGGAASRTLGHVGYPPPTPLPPGGR
jgi:hypothetical protein